MSEKVKEREREREWKRIGEKKFFEQHLGGKYRIELERKLISKKVEIKTLKTNQRKCEETF